MSEKISPWVEVALPLPVRDLFVYSLPEGLSGSAEPGARALVPVGRRLLTGVIAGRPGTPAIEAARIRPVHSLPDEAPLISGDLMDLALWAARYYVCGPGPMLAALLPPGLGRGSEVRVERTGSPGGAGATPDEGRLARALDRLPATGSVPFRSSGLTRSELRRLEEAGLARSWLAIRSAEVRPKERLWVRLAAEPSPEALATMARAPRQRQVFDLLKKAAPGGLALADLLDRLGPVAAAVAALRRKGSVRMERMEVRRAPEIPGARGAVGSNASARTATPGQAAVLDRILPAIESGTTASFLLMGVTGSGKTEVYLRAIERCLALGRSALYLVPEIALTPLLARDLAARLGPDLAILHSSLGRGERFDEWRRARSGEARVVLGPRSAVLAPVLRPGLIIVDEEQDGSYKQEEDPRYNARDLALVRARRAAGVALLGSATPSVETYHAARSGRHQLLTLPGRIGDRPMARVTVLDMRHQETRGPEGALVSAPLKEAVARCLSRGEQAILLLNRRGWAPFVQCRSCGGTEMCLRCSVTLTYHRGDDRVRCHYCGYQRGRPRSCSTCGSSKVALTGAGTERLEEHLRATFPEARLARLDRDVARGRRAPGEILSAFERGEFNLLVGTQMVAKGHDFPGVTVVGVLGADNILGMPDYRAAERVFQLVTQVAGRAGRGDEPGEVLVQAWNVDHYAMQAACRQDYAAFFEKESRFRRLMRYPPWSVMANVIVSADSHESGVRRATLAGEVIGQVAGSGIEVIGPAVAPLARLKGRHRFQILLKGTARRALSDALHEVAAGLAARGLASSKDLTIDLDPMSLV